MSDSEIIKLSLILYPDEAQEELREISKKLMASVHDRNPYHKVLFGKMMSFELMYKLGQFLNENDPLD